MPRLFPARGSASSSRSWAGIRPRPFRTAPKSRSDGCARRSGRAWRARRGRVLADTWQLGICGMQPRSKEAPDNPHPGCRSRCAVTSARPAPRQARRRHHLSQSRLGRVGWALRGVIDQPTRTVMGWPMASRMRTELIGDALRIVRTRGHVGTGAVFHSDQGPSTARRTSPTSQAICVCASRPDARGPAPITPSRSRSSRC